MFTSKIGLKVAGEQENRLQTGYASKFYRTAGSLATALVLSLVMLQPAAAGPDKKDKELVTNAVWEFLPNAVILMKPWDPNHASPAGENWDFISEYVDEPQPQFLNYNNLFHYRANPGAVHKSDQTTRLFTWANGSYVEADDKQKDTALSGHLSSFTGGAAVRLGDRAIAGVFGVIRDGRVTAKLSGFAPPLPPGGESARLDSKSKGGGAFAILRLMGDVNLSGSVQYEAGDHDFVISGFLGSTASFDSDQVTVQASLDKRFTQGRHWVQPGIGVRHTSLDRDGFVDSIGAVIPGDTLTLGSFTYGVSAGTTLPGDGGSVRAVRPFVSVNGIWNYERERDFVIPLTGATFANPDSGYSVGGGVVVAFTNGMAISVAGNHFAYDTALEGWSVSGGIGAPLSAFGIGNPSSAALVSLDFTGGGEGAGAMARLRIPLN